MNERIRELARRVVGKHRNDAGSISLFDEQIEKFAELLVLECADIAREYDAPKMSGPGMIIAVTIEQHFGVEE